MPEKLVINARQDPRILAPHMSNVVNVMAFSKYPDPGYRAASLGEPTLIGSSYHDAKLDGTSAEPAQLYWYSFNTTLHRERERTHAHNY